MSSSPGRSELDDRLDRLFKRKEAEAFAAMGLATVGDLLRRPPTRYVELAVLTDLAKVPVGEEITLVAEVVRTSRRPMQRRRGWLTEVVVTDGRQQMSLTFFNQIWREKQLPAGHRVVLSGKVGTYRGNLQLTHPMVEDDVDDTPLAGEGLPKVSGADDVVEPRPLPIYGLAKELTQGTARLAVWGLLKVLGDVPDPIPVEVRRRYHLLGLREAFQAVHRPAKEIDWRRGLKRLRWEEAFVLQVELARRRAEARSVHAVARTGVKDGLLSRFDADLPFVLTGGQKRIGAEIEHDLAAEHPMHRLLQGEVGTGKTVVALRAMLAVIDAGGQAALLAPTEVLAQQHYRSLTAMLGTLAHAGWLTASEVSTRVALLTGSMSTAGRRQAMLDAVTGDAGIVVGTHALLEEKVEFHDLGLVVIDEQHRFGVSQRDRLRTKGVTPPHVLVMTATPIPRTIAMTVFGDLDVSTLDEQPPGRPGVDTHVIPELDKPHFLERAWQRVREEVAAGHQAFVVCPQISGSDASSAELDEEADEDADAEDAAAARKPYAVLDLLPSLVEGDGAPFAGLTVAALHGRMAPETKEEVMVQFAAGKIDVVVATTVVEVGVDVPNATAMVIMDAHRFGMSALHQLRGRVARGSAKGVCLLVTSAELGSLGRTRVQTVADTSDGFQLAEADLDLRREGDVLGRRQSGWRTSLRHLRVRRDRKTIEEARAEANAIVESDPDLAVHPALRAEIEALAERDRADFLERG